METIDGIPFVDPDKRPKSASAKSTRLGTAALGKQDFSETEAWRDVPLDLQQRLLTELHPPGSAWHGDTKVGLLTQSQKGDR